MVRKFKRRNYFINKKFQTQFILKFTILIFFMAVVIAGLLLYFSSNSNTVVISNTQVSVKNTADFILPITITAVLAAMVICAVAVSLLTMVTSHKIAGPLYRIENELKELANGDLTCDFKIRGDDQLQVLAENLGQMCLLLRCKHSKIKESVAKLEAFLKDNNCLVSSEKSGELSNLINEVIKQVNVFKV